MYGHAVVLEEVEQRDDVRVVERGCKPRLADEALGQRRVVALQIEALQHHLAVQCRPACTRYTTAIPPRASIRTIS